MKLLLLTTFVIQILAAPNQIPDFVLLEDRSENGSPSVMINFPNGHKDKLILNKYYMSEEDERAEIEHCNYIGYLENESEACVAMTGCPGEEDVEFTIMSKHFPDASFIWSKDGQVQIVKSPFKSSYLDIPRADSNDTHNFEYRGDEIVDLDQEKLENEIEEFCWGGWFGWGCRGNTNNGGGGNGGRGNGGRGNGGNNGGWNPPPQPKPDQKTHYWQYKIAYDDLFRNIGGPSKLNAVMAHAQSRLCHHTLGHKYQLRKVGEQHVPGQRWYAKSGALNYLKETTKGYLGNAQTVLYFGDGTKTHNPQIGGEAWRGSICNVPSWRQYMCGINFWYGTTSNLGEITAHEMGHTIGAKHDSEHGGRCPDKSGIMSSATTHWSACSRADVQAHYIARKAHWCMPAAPSACAGYGR